MAIDIINKETGEVLTLPENTPDWVISNLFTMDVTKCTVFDTLMYFIDTASNPKSEVSIPEEIQRKLDRYNETLREVVALRGALRAIVKGEDYSVPASKKILEAACFGNKCGNCNVPCVYRLGDDELPNAAWCVLHGIPYNKTEFVKEAEDVLDISEDFEDDLVI